MNICRLMKMCDGDAQALGSRKIMSDLEETVTALINLVCERDKQLTWFRENATKCTEADGESGDVTCWSLLKLRLEKLQLEKDINKMRDIVGNNLGDIHREDEVSVASSDGLENKLANDSKLKEENIHVLLHEVLRENHSLKHQISHLAQEKLRSAESEERFQQHILNLESRVEELSKENLFLHKLLYKQKKRDYMENSSVVNRSSGSGNNVHLTTSPISTGQLDGDTSLNTSDGTSKTSRSDPITSGTKPTLTSSSTPYKQHKTNMRYLDDTSDSGKSSAATMTMNGDHGVTTTPPTLHTRTYSDDTDDLLDVCDGEKYLTSQSSLRNFSDSDLLISSCQNKRSVLVPSSVDDLKVGDHIKYLTPVNLIRMGQVLEVDKSNLTVKILDSSTRRIEPTNFNKILMICVDVVTQKPRAHSFL